MTGSAKSHFPIDLVTFLLLLPCRPASSFVSFCKLLLIRRERKHGRIYVCLYQNISPCVSAVFIPKQSLLCYMNSPVRKSSFQLSMIIHFPQENTEYIH